MSDSGGYLSRPAPSGLADVVETVLDKGIVIDAYVRVSVVGIEILTIDARIVVASVDTYLRFAEATNRLELEDDDSTSLPDMLTEGVEKATAAVASQVVEKEVRGGVETVQNAVEGAIETVADKAAGVVAKAADAVTSTPEDR